MGYFAFAVIFLWTLFGKLLYVAREHSPFLNFREVAMQSSDQPCRYLRIRRIMLCFPVVLLMVTVPALAQTQQKHFKKYSSGTSSAPDKQPRSMPRDAIPQLHSKALSLPITPVSHVEHVPLPRLNSAGPKRRAVPKIDGSSKPQPSNAPINFSYRAPSSARSTQSNSHRTH